MALLSWSVRRRWASLLVTSTLGAALLGGASPASAAPAGSGVNAPCAAIAPLSSVQAGQIGRGFTVVRGTAPRPFRVEVLGVFPDGVAPGRDIIMVKVSDLPGRSVIAAGGGIWSGMSGSPVYVDGRLIGAVAYGFSRGPSPIGGLTPAEDMARLLTLPSPSAASAATASARSGGTRLSAGLRRALSQRSGRSVAASGDFERLVLPLTVSGLSSRGLGLFADRLDDAGISARVVRGATVSAPAGPASTPVPGGNFAGMIAYGDVSVGGVGTTTWVCDDQALAFGHPLVLTGPAALGASDADALAIIKDTTDGSYKLAAIGGHFGTLDQDRLAGVRADLGPTPVLAPIISRVRDLDLGVFRRGRTRVAAADWMGLIAPSHLYANVISVTDRQGPGTAGVRHVIEGRRGDGSSWSLTVSDRLAGSDIQYQVAADLDLLVAQILGSGGSAVAITRIESQVKVREEVRAVRIRSVRFSRNGGEFTDPAVLRLRAGDEVTVRTTLRGGGDTRDVDVSFTVPASVSGFGTVDVAGGSSLYTECDFDPSACGGGLSGALARLAAAPRGDDLVVQLWAEGEDGFEAVITETERMPEVVLGSDTTEVRYR